MGMGLHSAQSVVSNGGDKRDAQIDLVLYLATQSIEIMDGPFIGLPHPASETQTKCFHCRCLGSTRCE